jgi:hypothetical protein
VELYPVLVWAHLLLFTFWLGADLGVAILGQAFRNRTYSLETRLVILKLLTVVDMGPRTAWVLMVPSTLGLLAAGNYWAVPMPILVGSWIAAGVWMWLVWAAHLGGQTPRTAALKQAEFWLKVGLTLFYAWLGVSSVLGQGPLGADWLGWKAVLFALIFAAAIMIDVAFKPVGPLLMRVVNDGSSDATEIPLRAAMDVTRAWVWVTYVLLFIISWLGAVKPF